MIKPGNTGRVEDFIAKSEAAVALAARDAAYLLAGSDQISRQLVAGTDQADGGGVWIAQKFRTSSLAYKLRTLQMHIQTASQGATWQLKLRSSLTGPDLASGSGSYGYSGSNGSEKPSIDANYLCAPNTDYYLIGIYTNNFYGTTSNEDPDGQAYRSTDSGATWGAANNGILDFKILVQEEYGANAAGKLGKASAGANDAAFNNFVGFIQEATAVGAQATVNPQLVITGFTGLTPGAKYYLSNTPGAISTTPGSNNKMVGIAINATTIIRHTL